MEGKEVLPIEDYENPVNYWQERSRRAMEAMGMAVVRPEPIPPTLPPGVIYKVEGNCDELPIGLVCNTCSTRMLPFTRLVKCIVHYYDKEATVPFKLLIYCVNMKCKAEIIVERNKEVQDYVVLSGATRYFPLDEDNSGSRVRFPIAGSSSASHSEGGGDNAGNRTDDRAGKQKTEKKVESTCYHGRQYWERSADDDFLENADEHPFLFGHRVYLGGPRGQRRFRKATAVSTRRWLSWLRRRSRILGRRFSRRR